MSKQQTKTLNTLEGLAGLKINQEGKMALPEKQPEQSQPPPTHQDTAPNVGWLFYFDYFRKWDTFGNDLQELSNENPDPKNMKNLLRYLQDRSNNLFKLVLAKQKPSKWHLQHLTAVDTFQLTTTYPGLLVGIGYQHETKIEGELKLGFYFDYTSGLPVIPGSSIKGALRSAFRGKHWDFLREVLLENNIFPKDDLPDDAELEKWELELFEGVKNPDAPDDQPRERYLRPSGMDVFHDAIIWKSQHNYTHEAPENQPYDKGTFLGQDYITPHNPGKPFGAFKDPVPLRFMKVLPNVVFLFQFDLKNSEQYPLLTKQVKLRLFKHLLLSLGIGAKTNVGYGQLTEIS